MSAKRKFVVVVLLVVIAFSAGFGTSVITSDAQGHGSISAGVSDFTQCTGVWDYIQPLGSACIVDGQIQWIVSGDMRDSD